MAPDASKSRQDSFSYVAIQGSKEDSAVFNETLQKPLAANSESLECVLKPRVLTSFAYEEQPMKCYLTHQGKRLACNGKSACFMRSGSSTSDDGMDEFVLLQQANGSIVLRNAKTQQLICSASNGGVYAPKTCHADLEKWIMSPSKTKPGHCTLGSFANPGRNLVCNGNIVETRGQLQATEWKVDILSGEVCHLTHAAANQHLYCDLLGNLSMSKTQQGWTAWRFSEVGNGCVRISPWAHSNFYLTSSEEGKVSVTEERGLAEIWSVEKALWSVDEKAPNALVGVTLAQASTGRVLQYDSLLNEFRTVPGGALNLDASCVWDLESLHRQTYYLVANNGDKRLAAGSSGVTTRGLPGRLSSEEWKIEQSSKQSGVVTLYSHAREQYLGSNALGEVIMMTDKDGCSEKWVIEEREDGFVVLSQTTRRVLVSNNDIICTVEPGTIVYGSTRWKLEPRVPRQISKEKVQKVGSAVAIGVAGTVAMPFLIGGALGALGIANVGIAGEVAIGSIRAAEVLNTVTNITLSSSQIMLSQSSSLSSSSSNDKEPDVLTNRPFCAWRTW